MKKQNLADLCPCGSSLLLSNCCSLLLNGEALAKTPEQLMRSRYTAFVFNDVEYYLATTHRSTRAQADPAAFLEWGKQIEWKRLEVKAVSKIVKDKGKVEFIAWYIENGKLACIHERSDFEREAGTWFYVSGKHLPCPSIGRNEACICKSGKKFKKCCGR